LVKAGRAILATGGVGVGAKGALETGKARGFTGVFLMESGGAGGASGGVGGVAVVLFAGAVLATRTVDTIFVAFLVLELSRNAIHAFGSTCDGHGFTNWAIHAFG